MASGVETGEACCWSPIGPASPRRRSGSWRAPRPATPPSGSTTISTSVFHLGELARHSRAQLAPATVGLHEGVSGRGPHPLLLSTSPSRPAAIAVIAARYRRVPWYVADAVGEARTMIDDRLAMRLPATLTDGVVVLDAHRPADAEAHLRGEDDEMRRRFDSPRPSTLGETRAAIEQLDRRACAAGGPMFAYAIRGPTGVLVGGCEIRPLDAERASVSYWIFPDFRGRGYATRALRLMCECGRGLRRVRASGGADRSGQCGVAAGGGTLGLRLGRRGEG